MTRPSGSFFAPRAARLCGLLACAVSLAFAQSRPIPQLLKSGDKFTLMVDGRPFIMLGGQVDNFSGFPDRMERASGAFRAMSLNTVEYPVYWNVIEPEEGKFDFSGFDQILRGLRSQGLRAVILWFGTWKNGAMDWSPNWVKADPSRFARVLDRGGQPIRVLSPHSGANLEADKKAYTAMMKHLRDVDEADRTVILMQVENEPGLLGSVRDYSADSNKSFNSAVPDRLVTALKKKPGTWKELFGREAEEAFSAYAVSSYINEVARAGKEVYPLPAFVNVWNGGYGTNDNWERFDRPDESYPSGGAVSHMLDLWKANAPAIDAIASDNYHQNPITHLKILSNYTRPDNPLLIVETGMGIAARGFYYAVADFSAIGFGYMGVDMPSGPEMAAVGADFRLFNSAAPVIAGLQGTPHLKAAVEETGSGARNLIFGSYDLLVRFRPPERLPAVMIGQPAVAAPSGPSASVLIAELGPDEFLVMGCDSSVEWRPVQGSNYTAAQLLQVEEGAYENGVWKRTVIGPTSQSDYGNPTVRLSAAGALLRVKLMKY